MAYAYPSGGDGTNSSSSLTAHSSPGKTHSNTTSRKGSGEQFDILREIKVSSDDHLLSSSVHRACRDAGSLSRNNCHLRERGTSDRQVKIDEDENYLQFFQDR
jgi:hypothetical protein